MMKWYIAADLHPDRANGGDYYRLALPFRHNKAWLESRGVVVESGLNPTFDYDCLWFSRSPDPHVLPFVIEAKRRGKVVVWDLDDDVKTLVRPEHAGEEVKAKLNCLDICISIADVLVTINDALAGQLARHHKTVVCPNLIDLDDHPVKTHNIGGPILFTGSATHHEDVELLREFYESTKSRQSWVWYGYQPDWATDSPYIGWTRVKDYGAVLRMIRPSFGLAPLQPTKFSESKSPIKAWEYAAAGACVVASKVGPYVGHPGAVVEPGQIFGPEHIDAALDAQLESVIIAKANSWQHGDDGKAAWRKLFDIIIGA